MDRPEFGTRKPDEIRRGEIQLLVDAMAGQGLSGSRIRNVINSLRALYTYMISRDLCPASPVASIRLPAMDETPRDRVATPPEFARLLSALPAEDALPYALAGYASGRRAEIRKLTWPNVGFAEELIFFGRDGARKSRAARRRAPLVSPLRTMLRTEWLRQGKPSTGLVCPGLKPGGRNSGLLSFEALQARADDLWEPKDEDGKLILAKKIGDRITAARAATPAPPGSTPQASAPSSRPRSWATLLPVASPRPATRTSATTTCGQPVRCSLSF